MKYLSRLQFRLIAACATGFAVSTYVRGVDASAPPSAQSQPAPKQVRPPAPTRLPTAPGTPKLTPVGAKAGEALGLRGAPGQNPPIDADGDFLIGPDYSPAPELAAVEGVPKGTVQKFTMK